MAEWIFVVRSNAQPGQDAEFNHWYNTRHLVDVVGMEGFTGAQRFARAAHAGDDGGFGYLALYEADDVARAGATLAASRGTPRMPMSGAINPATSAWWFVAADGGPALGGRQRGAVLVEFLNPAGDAADFAARYVAEAIPSLAGQGGITNGRLLRLADYQTRENPPHSFVALYDVADATAATSVLRAGAPAAPARRGDSQRVLYVPASARMDKAEALGRLAIA